MKTRRVVPAACAVFGVLACHNIGGRADSVLVTMRSAAGTQVGALTLTQGVSGVHITGQIAQLSAGMHGVHFHQVARCDGADFASAGGHVNPTMRQHGLSNPAGPHQGDLPNIEAMRDGRAVIDITTSRVTLDNAAITGLFDVDGSALVVHADADDQRTDPAGASGARFACGMIILR